MAADVDIIIANPCEAPSMKFRTFGKKAAVVAGVYVACYTLMYFTTGVPNVIGPLQQSLLVTELNHRWARLPIEISLRLTFSQWGQGEHAVSCEDSSSRNCVVDYPEFGPGTQCDATCATETQAAFADFDRVCSEMGNVVTMRFKPDGSLERWLKERASSAGGC